MTSFAVGPLPDGALDAAAHFHAEVLPRIRAAVAPAGRKRKPAHLAIVFPPAAYDHHGWRLTAVQDLARAAAPLRVNGVVGEDSDAIGETLAWLEAAPAITGQLLAVEAQRAG